MPEKIIDVSYSDEIQQSYLDYSLSVIISRALPELCSGQKIVHQRLLYDMHLLGLKHDRPFKKCSRPIGDTMAKFHAHSEAYGALIGLMQDFRKNAPLVDGHGNVSSVTDLSFAAMRYTECRLEKFTEDVLLADLDKNVVDFVDNYDQTEKEPSVLPSKIPLLLINGSEGIAVGLTTAILPHSLIEIIDAEIAYMKNPKIAISELMKIVKGPDMPTGGTIVSNKSELKQIYETGEGKIYIRGKIEVEELKGGKKQLVITEIPYTMIGATDRFLSSVIDLIENKTLPEIVDVSDQTNRDGIRMVLELRKDADVERVKNLLFKKTKLEDTYGVHMMAVHQNKPILCNLKDILKYHSEFRFECETRKYTHLLAKEQDKQEIQEGLIKACDVIDLIIEILRGSKNVKDAKACLMYGDTFNITFKKKSSEKEASSLSFTERQAQAILDMRLQKLIGLEVEALKKEYAQTLKNIKTCEDILGNKKSMMKVIIEDLERIKKEYGRPRRTIITDIEEVVIEEKKMEEQDVILLMDRFGYARTMDVSVYEKNKEAADSENKYIIACKNIGKICLFTNTGKMHQIKVSDLPYGNFRSKGIPIDNVSNFNSAEEEIVWIGSESQLVNKKFLFSTKLGLIKQVDGSEFQVIKKTIAATSLNDGDELISIHELEDRSMVVIQTKDGYFLKFLAEQVPEKKKGAVGVRGIKLQSNDVVEAIHVYRDGVETKIQYKNKELTLNRLKEAKRDGTGNKQK